MKYINLIVFLFVTSGIMAQGNQRELSGKKMEGSAKKTPASNSEAIQEGVRVQESEKGLDDQQDADFDELNQRSDSSAFMFGDRMSSDDYLLDFKTAGFQSYNSESLKSAYELSPNKLDLMDEMLGDAEVRGDLASKKQFAAKIKNSGKYSDYKYEYAKNLLQSVGYNGFLICNGEVDTYPLLVVQELQGFRKDVKIINLKLVKNETYWNNLSSTYGLKGAYSSSYTQFVNNLMQNNSDKGLYLTLNNRHDVLKHFKSNLYLTGLAFRLSKTAINNQELLKTNWQKFELSKFKSKNKISVDKKLDYSYILILQNLNNFYGVTSGKGESQYKDLAKTVAKNNGSWDQVKSKFD